MKLLLLLFALMVMGCETPEKPFIIIDMGSSYGAKWYKYVGSNGATIIFYDQTNLYQIGDTIK